MSQLEAPARPTTRFVDHLPDLITADDYRDPPTTRKIRMRIVVTDEGVEVLGDSMYAALVEKILAEMGAPTIERMLCG